MISAVLDALTDLSESRGWSSIRSVTLKIGSMRQVIPQSLRFAFDVCKGKTPATGAELVIVPVPVEFCCRSCGGSWGEEHMGYLCPFCGGTDVDMIHGMELDIDSLEVEE